MKRILFIMCAVAGVLSMASCGSQKKVAERNDMVEVNIPLSGAQYRTDKEYFRTVQNAESTNESMAKKIAIQNARQELAQAVKNATKQVIENYAAQSEVDSASQYQAQYQELAYTVIDESLVGAGVADEKLFKQSNGKYKYYVCLQMAKEDIKKAVIEKISADEKLKLDFDLDRFRKTYDEQMAKFVGENK